MLSSGKSLRFTAGEIDRHAQIGLDLHDVRSVGQFAREIERWALVMSEVRPDVVARLERMLRDRLAEEQGEAEAAHVAPAARVTSA